MRLFIALTFEEEFLREIEKNIKDIKKKFPGKWIPRENWHLTLAFLGENYKKEKIIDFLRKNFSNFEFKFLITQKIDWAPPGKIARMVWLYFRRENFEFFEKIFKEFKVENFLPHINLLRFKPRNKNNLFKIEKKIQIETKPKDLVLFNSVLKKPFAEYEKIYNLK